jgi:hypothetical protein
MRRRKTRVASVSSSANAELAAGATVGSPARTSVMVGFVFIAVAMLVAMRVVAMTVVSPSIALAAKHEKADYR